MGCGATVAADKEPETVTAEPETVTWATKTEVAQRSGDQPVSLVAGGPAQRGTSNQPAQTSSGRLGPGGNFAGQRQQAFVLQDAEDDDDEIEIIYESPSTRVRSSRDHHNSAANGQEGPDFLEEDKPEPLQLNVSPSKPLSKQQQEEAAKLADARKRFDNQRYVQSQETKFGYPYDDQSPKTKPGQSGAWGQPPSGHREAEIRRGPGTPQSTPSHGHDLVMGLNRSNDVVIGYKEPPVAQECLPGGIFEDEVEEVRKPKVMMHSPPSRPMRHDMIKNTSFDADDEALMEEILEMTNP